MKRLIAIVVLFVAAGVSAPAGQQPVPPDPRLGSASADLELAKGLAREEKYNEALAKIEDAARKIKAIRDTAVGQPDLAIIAINGDGNKVTVTVKNQGTADVILSTKIGPAQQLKKEFVGFAVKIVNAVTDKDFLQHQPLRGAFAGSLPPGQTAQVSIGPITGCGGMKQKIKALVATSAPESNTNNNTSDVFEVRGGPCGS